MGGEKEGGGEGKMNKGIQRGAYWEENGGRMRKLEKDNLKDVF
jgi:hypothetical protein